MTDNELLKLFVYVELMSELLNVDSIFFIDKMWDCDLISQPQWRKLVDYFNNGGTINDN